MPSTPIQLLVGLGNPGEEYAHTRHNIGAIWLQRFCSALNVPLRLESKFHAKTAKATIAGQTVFLAQPTTFMNLSGQSVRAIAQFYHIPPASILVIHDELDFSVGTVRLKKGGGHGGHNGLRDIMRHLQTDEFYRLRIGIGHPGTRHQVHDYVLSRPSVQDFLGMCDAMDRSITLLPELIASGDLEKAMQKLHTQ